MKSKASLLNKKNIVLILVIFFLIVIAILLFGLSRNHKSKETEKTIIYSSDDSSISVTLSDKQQFSKVESDSYKFALSSSVLASNIYFSEVKVTNIRNISKFIEADKNDYISKFSNISQVSDITEKIVCGNKAYNYHFYYKNNMYVDVYWIIKGDTFIIIDFNINTDKTNLSMINDFLNNLSLN